MSLHSTRRFTTFQGRDTSVNLANALKRAKELNEWKEQSDSRFPPRPDSPGQFVQDNDDDDEEILFQNTPLLMKLGYPFFLILWIFYQSLKFILRTGNILLTYFFLNPIYIAFNLPFVIAEGVKSALEALPKRVLFMSSLVSLAAIYWVQNHGHNDFFAISNFHPLLGNWSISIPWTFLSHPIAPTEDYSNTLKNLYQKVADLEASFKDSQQAIQETTQRFSSLEKANSDFHDEQAYVVGTLSGMQQDFNSVFSSVRDLSSQIPTSTENFQPPHQTIIASLIEKVEHAASQVWKLDEKLKMLQQNYTSMEQYLSDMGSTVDAIEDNVIHLKEEVIILSNEEKLAKKWTRLLEEVLPEYLVAQKNPISGMVELSPEFYNYLSTVFVREDHVRELLNEKMATSQQALGEEDIKKLSSLIFKENIPLLKELVYNDTVSTNDVDADIKDSHVLSKTSVLCILENEFIKAQQTLDDSKSTSITSSSSSPSEVLLKVIESALSKYAADRIGLPDYALTATGARVVPYLTSTSYVRTPNSQVGLALYKMFGVGSIIGKPPTVALQEDVSIGNCWAFSGQQGNLTIKLLKPMIPSDFTIEHVDPRVALDMSSAPKEVEVWGLVNDPLDINLDTTERVLLSTYTYQITPPSYSKMKLAPSIQTFPVKGIMTRPLQYIQLQIKSNHGHPLYTCLYRFRVHAKEQLNE